MKWVEPQSVLSLMSPPLSDCFSGVWNFFLYLLVLSALSLSLSQVEIFGSFSTGLYLPTR